MLKLRTSRPPHAWLVSVDGVVSGLHEDRDYTIDGVPGAAGLRVYVDDVEILPDRDGQYPWRPAFYAGRVPLDLVQNHGETRRYWLDVAPSPSKSGDECFSDMVRAIRGFDPRLLIGEAPAGMVFGREGQPGLFANDVLLARLRIHGPLFLVALHEIAKAPHRSISPASHRLPLFRARRLHPGALRERRVLALASGTFDASRDLDTVLIRSLTVEPTFDTPANRALVALLRRMLATLRRLQGAVDGWRLAGDREEQARRRDRRQAELASLEAGLAAVLKAPPFSEVANSQTSAAGLTQIAAQPLYSRAYRAGCSALASGVRGDERADLLHVIPTWAIYETWCYLEVLAAARQVVGSSAVSCRDGRLSSQFAHRFDFADGQVLHAFFQAIFPSIGVDKDLWGHAISRERRPDIVLVHTAGGVSRTLVLDAKWRSGRDNVLDAMESAHIYHDALRLEGRRPDRCVLLLPGAGPVPALEHAEFLQQHGVGAVSQFVVGEPGRLKLEALLLSWLKSAPVA